MYFVGHLVSCIENDTEIVTIFPTKHVNMCPTIHIFIQGESRIFNFPDFWTVDCDSISSSMFRFGEKVDNIKLFLNA